MFGRTKARLSLMFNRKAIRSHRFEKNTAVSIRSEFTGRHSYYAPAKSKVWAEALPVSNGLYAVTRKEVETHNASASARSMFYKSGVSATFDNRRKTLFTRDEAIAVLKSMEKDFENDGYRPSQKQPFKKRIYTNKEVPAKEVPARRMI